MDCPRDSYRDNVLLCSSVFHVEMERQVQQAEFDREIVAFVEIPGRNDFGVLVGAFDGKNGGKKSWGHLTKSLHTTPIHSIASRQPDGALSSASRAASFGPACVRWTEVRV
jgi:hypothetical protein